MHRIETNNNKWNGCGCGGTTKAKSCGNPNCITAPQLHYACANSPACGETFNINIFEESESELKDGFEVILVKYDKQGYESVSLDADGNLSGLMKNSYSEGRFDIKVRICEIDGPRSATGCISYCIKNLCSGEECEGTCDPCTGKWICTNGSEVDGSVGVAPTTTETNIEDPFFHNISIQNDGALDLSPLAELDASLLDHIENVEASNNLIKDGYYIDELGNLIFEQNCGVGQVIVTYDVCDPANPEIKDSGEIIINVDNPPAECHYCDENGVEQEYIDSAKVIIFDTEYLESIEVNVDGTISSYIQKCREDLPKTIAVTIEKEVCGDKTTEQVMLDLPCPENCGPCNEGGVENCPDENNEGSVINPDDSGCSMCSGSCNGSCVQDIPVASCPVECIDTEWLPNPLIVKEGEPFQQTSNCGNKRDAVGECPVEPECTSDDWSPATDTVCEGEPMKQVNACGEVRDEVGTKLPTSWYPDPEDYCAGDEFEQVSDCGTKRMAVGTKVEVWSPLPEEVKEGKKYNMSSNCGNIVEAVGTCPVVEPCDPETWSPNPDTQCEGKNFRQVNDCGEERFAVGTYVAPCPPLSNFPEGQDVYNACGEICGVGTGENCPHIPEECSVTNDTDTTPSCVGENDFVNLKDNVVGGDNAIYGLPYNLSNLSDTDITDNGDGTYNVNPKNEGQWCFYVDVEDSGLECGTIKVTGTATGCENCSIDDLQLGEALCDDGNFYFDIIGYTPNGSSSQEYRVNDGTGFGVWDSITPSGIVDYNAGQVAEGTIITVEVRDVLNNECEASATIIATSCEECTIDNLTAGEVTCELGISKFNVSWDQTNGSGVFEGCIAEIDGGSWFDISSGMNWVIVAPTVAGDEYTIKVRDKNDPTCISEITITAVDCEEVHTP